MKQRKMLLMLPVLVIPFLTMAFWALGGGRSEQKKEATAGLNAALPGMTNHTEEAIDKLGFYDRAEKDSLKMEDWMRSDPYFTRDTEPSLSTQLENLTQLTGSKYGQRLNTSLDENKNTSEDQLLQRLQLLQAEMNKPGLPGLPLNPPPREGGRDTEKYGEEPLEETPADDSELKQLQGTLDRILDIQHPDRVKERSTLNREAAYAVRKEKYTDTLVKGFYSYSDEKEMEEQNAVDAIIATHQTVVNGGVVKFRTVTDIYVNGKLIPKDNIISGIASLDGERLRVEINSIRCGKSLYSVKLEVYDMDGLPGIYIPGTINREVAKESLNNGLGLADMTSLDPSFKAQATATGIGALKSLISKKAKLVRVQLKAGYNVLLKNKN